jgi:site-specific DNA-methyltransferase (adenine-specific)
MKIEPTTPEVTQVDLTYFTGKKYGRTPDILECLANLSSDEVFTHPKTANEMLDLIPKEVWVNPNLKWLDPCAKSGVFLREIAKRLLETLKVEIPDETTRREHIFKHMLYGIGITAITSEIARRSLYCSKDANGPGSAVTMGTAQGNIYFEDTQHTFVGAANKKSCKYCQAPDPQNTETDEVESEDTGINAETHAYAFIHPNNLTKLTEMKFDVIIGNPPYQLKDGGNGASAKPLYHLFIQQAKLLKPKYLSMIVPARWFAGGKGLDEFREEMLNDSAIKHLVDYPNASDCFPDVEIKGGVCYFLRDAAYSGECEITTRMGKTEDKMVRPLNSHGTFVRFNKAVSILSKVVAHKLPSMALQVSSRKPFGLATNVIPNKSGDVELYANKAVGYYDKEKLTAGLHYLPLWKVLLSKAYGAGEGYPHQIVGLPIVIPPNSACTETYLIIGTHKTEAEAKNLLAYIRTRFVRFLIALKKNTQDVTKDKYEFVPVLDMTKTWDDETLYAYFGITPLEREFIESLIKEIE